MNYIDLHTHTTASDGSMSPTELIDYAITKNLSAIAITDHDTIVALPIAKAHGKNKAIEVISGIEFSTNHPTRPLDIHILGYFVDENNSQFVNSLKQIIDSRNERNQKLIKKLNSLGKHITLEDVEKTAFGNVITRSHFAKALFEKGYVNAPKDAFTSLIGNHCPAFIPREKLTQEIVIKMILDCGGIPVLAHPTLYHLDLKELEALIKELKGYGLMGIEGIYSLHTKSEENYIKNYAKKYNLLVTGGSDFHGSPKPSIDLGVGRGNLAIPLEILENMKAAIHK
jgi:predicted metal-dependent phosphoesterase TrpH